MRSKSRADPVLWSIQVGRPRSLGTEGAIDAFDRPWTTGIFKTAVAGPVYLTAASVAGDAQADLVNHGGPDKAVCAYSGDHYDAWREIPELSRIEPGAFGENFTIRALAEDEVCVGDVWSAGSVILQVSQPRQPCWKLARRWKIRDFVDRVVSSGRTGWYFRVLQEGWIQSGATLTLVERPAPQWTITAANRVMHGRPRDRSLAAALAGVPALSGSWRAALAKR